jgi:hypothetical protein
MEISERQVGERGMTPYIEYQPGEPAPSAGSYELINVAGSPVGVQIEMPHGHPFPSAPLGQFWRAVGAERKVER